MGYKSWAPGYRGRLTVFTFIFDLWILVMFDPMKKIDSVNLFVESCITEIH